MKPFSCNTQDGFTLIELSIVLVIIGLIVGGVLVGQDLVRNAEVRAQITQIEKYNTAANTFRGKYGYLPGDINSTAATQFGFAARGQYSGEGDGNGVIEGVWANWQSVGCCYDGSRQTTGETVMFWADLSQVHMVDGSFNTASSNTLPGGTIPATGVSLYLPPAKMHFDSVYVWSANSINYFGLVNVGSINADGFSDLAAAPNIPVQQAYKIDSKIDDGLPQSGRITAQYGIGSWSDWGVSGTQAQGGYIGSCYDNGGNAGSPQQYSLEINGGAGANCALSFQFQ